MTDSTVRFDAKLDPLASTNIEPRSWFITHALGGPAAGMFTEVRFGFPKDVDVPEPVLDDIVRKVAHDLYGNKWAFHYRPDQYETSIQTDRWELTRREVVVVTDIEMEV